MRLYVIPAGTLRIDKGAVFTPGIDDGVLIEIPVPVYLIRTDNDENVLVDTGLHPAHIDDPSHSFGLDNADEVLARMQPEDRLEPRLAEVGLEIADITHVVNTHLHADHCGGNFLFPHAELIVQRDHYQEALAHSLIPDALFHGPGWTEPPVEEFRLRVATATDGSGWIVDGNYESSLGDLVLERADTVVWLDVPLRVALTRVTRRTIRRIRTNEELWNRNRESWRGGFLFPSSRRPWQPS